MTSMSSVSRDVQIALALSGITLILAGGLQAARAANHRSATSSVQDTMNRLIDPAADALWGCVGTEETKQGSHLRAPRTGAEWLKAASYAQSLVSGARRLQTQGLPIGRDAHSKLADADTAGTRTAAQIRADIDADPARFRAAAKRLEDAANQALVASRKHDVDGLLDAGAALDTACETCHAAYWYPRTPPMRLPSPEDFAMKAAHH